MAKKIPAAGRPARVPAAKVPKRVPGATGGKMRDRTDADKPWKPIGIAAQPGAKNPPKTRRRNP